MIKTSYSFVLLHLYPCYGWDSWYGRGRAGQKTAFWSIKGWTKDVVPKLPLSLNVFNFFKAGEEIAKSGPQFRFILLMQT